MENGKTRVSAARRISALDVCVKIIGAIIFSDIAENKEICLILNNGSHLLIGCHRPDQTGRNDLRGWIDRSQDFFRAGFLV